MIRGKTDNLFILGIVTGSLLTCLSYSLELIIPDLALKMLLVLTRYAGLLTFLVLTLFYGLWFTDLWKKTTPFVKWLICLPSFLTLIIIITNPLHHLYYSQVDLIAVHGFKELVHTNGPLYYAVQIYALTLSLFSIIVFIRWKIRSPRAYSPAVTLFLIGFVSPVVGDIIYLSGFRLFGYANVTPYFLSITAFSFALAIIRFHALTLKPIAHQNLIDELPVGMIIYDDEMRIIEINPAARHLLALDGIDVIHRLIYEIFTPDDPIYSYCLSVSMDSFQVIRGGRYLMLNHSSIKDYHNERIGSLLRITDITVEKEGENKIKKDSSLMNATFNSIHDGILVVGIDRKIMAVNNQFCKLWDIPEDLIGKNDDREFLKYASKMVITPDDFATKVEELTLEENVDEEVIHLKNGKTLERYSIPLFVDGSLIGRIWSFHDLTELKRKEYALLESEAKYKLILENAADMIWTLTSDGVLSYVSPSWERIIGYSVEYTVGKEYRQFLHPDDLKHCEEYFIQSIQKKERIQDPEYRVIHADGILHWHIAAGIPVFDSNGSFVSFIGVSRDITDRKMTELALRQANRQLNLLTSITRHDILNLITAMLGYIDLSEDITTGAEIATIINKLRSLIEAIQSQIEFTRVYENLGSHDPQWQNISSIIGRIWIPAGMAFTVNSCEVSVYADTMLQKVFENLIDNSKRHGKEVTSIKISCQKTEDGFFIFYEDDGVGVIQEEKNIIFKRGFGKNTGLGLFLVRDILAMTGITIQETGKPGIGVRFEIKVPEEGYRTYG